MLRSVVQRAWLPLQAAGAVLLLLAACDAGGAPAQDPGARAIPDQATARDSAAAAAAAADASTCLELRGLLEPELLPDSLALSTDVALRAGETRRLYSGCRLYGTGSFERAASPELRLMAVFEAAGFIPELLMSVGGPEGSGSGYRRNADVCLYHLQWVGHDDSDPTWEPEPPWDEWFSVEVLCVHEPDGAPTGWLHPAAEFRAAPGRPGGSAR